MLVEIVFRYRTLIGKCELGVGLDWDEIELVSEIERSFTPGPADRRSRHGRRFLRHPVKLEGIVRGDRINDPIEVLELGPGGLVLRRAPFIARGEEVEIVIDEGDRSYRFRARGVWLRDDGEDYRCGLQLVGMPVCLTRVQLSKHEADVIDRIAAAA